MGSEWVYEEMKTLKLADERLTKRAKQMIASMSEQPAKSIPEASENWAATKGAYRFLENDKVKESQIRATHYQATQARASGQPRILAIQDTTDLDYTGKQVAEQLGPLSNQYTRGLRTHSVLAASVEGVPLGLVDQFTWNRDADTQGKESQRWLDAVQATEKSLPPDVEIVHIADREGDIYDLLAVERQASSQLLIRMSHNRQVEHETRYLWEAIRQAPLAG